MAKTATTLAGAIGTSDWIVNTANNAAMRPGDNIVVGTAPNQESMKALVVDPNVGAIVYRGNRGTAALAAAAGATVSYGPPTDWGAGVGLTAGVTRTAEPFEAEARSEVAAEDEEKQGERVEKKRKDLEKKSADEAKTAADARAAADAKAEKAEKNAQPSAHK